MKIISASQANGTIIRANTKNQANRRDQMSERLAKLENAAAMTDMFD